MRRLISLSLVLVMLLCGTANADFSIDLTLLSIDELIALHRLLNTEIEKRIGEEPSMIGGGVYIAGKTIKAGTYIVTCSESYSDEGMTVQMFESKSAHSLFLGGVTSNLLCSQSLQVGQSMSVSLSDGMVLVIEHGMGVADAVSPTWAP